MRWLRRDPVVRALKHAPRASDEIAEVLQATPMLVLYSELLPVRVPKEEDRATVLTWATERLLPRDRRLSYPARERELRNAILYEWRHHVRGTLETEAQKDLWLDVFSQTHDRRWMYDETWEESGRARAPEPRRVAHLRGLIHPTS